MKKEVALLIADTSRARAYLTAIISSNVELSEVILIDCSVVNNSISHDYTNLFDNVTPIEERLIKEHLNYRKIKSDNINNSNVVKAVQALKAHNIITAGPPGALLRKALFKTGKFFIHVHPGRLPEFRGSTPMYYSILRESKLTATAMFLEMDIDTGGVITEMDFSLPKDMPSLDHFYDPWMRAEVLKKVLSIYNEKGYIPSYQQSPEGGETWYVIHPLLKHLAIMK